MAPDIASINRRAALILFGVLDAAALGFLIGVRPPGLPRNAMSLARNCIGAQVVSLLSPTGMPGVDPSMSDGLRGALVG